MSQAGDDTKAQAAPTETWGSGHVGLQGEPIGSRHPEQVLETLLSAQYQPLNVVSQARANRRLGTHRTGSQREGKREKD